MDNQENMNQEELDLIELTDDEGNTMQMEVLRYFFYNGEEYVVLGEADDCDCEECADGKEERACFIMKAEETEEDGEETEVFIPIEDDELYDKLIEVAEANFAEDENLDD